MPPTTDRSKTTVILIAGSWHNAIHTTPAIRLLESAGYTVIGCHPFARARSSYDDDMQFVKSTIERELQNDQEVVLIVHSLAARAGCEALNQISATDSSVANNVKHFIWCASFLTTHAPDMPALLHGQVIMDMEKGTASVRDPYHLFFNDMARTDAKPYADGLEPVLNLYQPLELSSEAYKSIPMTYIQCSEDNIVPVELQTREAKENGMSVVKMKAGHCPFVSQPQAFVEVVEKIIEQS